MFVNGISPGFKTWWRPKKAQITIVTAVSSPATHALNKGNKGCLPNDNCLNFNVTSSTSILNNNFKNGQLLLSNNYAT